MYTYMIAKSSLNSERRNSRRTILSEVFYYFLNTQSLPSKRSIFGPYDSIDCTCLQNIISLLVACTNNKTIWLICEHVWYLPIDISEENDFTRKNLKQCQQFNSSIFTFECLDVVNITPWSNLKDSCIRRNVTGFGASREFYYVGQICLLK